MLLTSQEKRVLVALLGIAWCESRYGAIRNAQPFVC